MLGEGEAEKSGVGTRDWHKDQRVCDDSMRLIKISVFMSGVEAVRDILHFSPLLRVRPRSDACARTGRRGFCFWVLLHIVVTWRSVSCSLSTQTAIWASCCSVAAWGVSIAWVVLRKDGEIVSPLGAAASRYSWSCHIARSGLVGALIVWRPWNYVAIFLWHWRVFS